MFYKIINHQVDIPCHHILKTYPDNTCSSSSSKKSYTYPQEFIHITIPSSLQQLITYPIV